MTIQERRAWIMLLVSTVAYVGYVVVVVSRADGAPLAQTSYAAPLLWSIGLAIAAAIVLEVLVAIVRQVDTTMDVRDREIGRLGDSTGQAFVVIGGLAALLMSLAEWPYFWIANVIYFCFFLSAILGSVTKIVLYRKGMP